MGYNTQFISDLSQFEDILFSIIQEGTSYDIFISGMWNSVVFQEILNVIC